MRRDVPRFLVVLPLPLLNHADRVLVVRKKKEQCGKEELRLLIRFQYGDETCLELDLDERLFELLATAIYRSGALLLESEASLDEEYAEEEE